VFTEPFRGSTAVARGLVTPGRLRGPRFRRLFQDIYVAAEVEVDLALRSRAAYLVVAGCGVLGGWSAAELLDASCGPKDAPAEVITRRYHRAQPGLRVRQDRVPADEITTVGRIPVTNPQRTAFDLARRPPRVDGVIAVDALARVYGFAPAELRALDRRHLGGRGSCRLAAVLRLANPLAGSPMETRIRLAIVDAGLPVAVLQHPVGPYRLDLAYPAIQLAIEYDGREHLTQERALRDLDRQAYLSAAGWGRVLRFRAAEAHQPAVVATRVRGELAGYARRHNLSLDDAFALCTRAGATSRPRAAGIREPARACRGRAHPG
jgi:very-short-patch-repair endonuclease